MYCFGVADATHTPECLLAYGYTEGDGAKGGNNIASLLMRALRDLNWLVDGRCGKRLSIIMDNCTGQNKNGHVLRLALWLVELQYFQSVEFKFYVRGHTKNMCDRIFNLLKKRYHHSNIYSVKSLSLLLNEIDNITYTHVLSDVFFDYLQLFDNFYKKFQPGTVKKHHLFLVEAEHPPTMIAKSYHNDEFGSHSTFDHNIIMNDQIIKMKDAFNNKFLLRVPGIKPIKQVGLWKKWGKFIPHHERQELCPKPSDEVIQFVASERTAKRSSKKRTTPALATEAAKRPRERRTTAATSAAAATGV